MDFNDANKIGQHEHVIQQPLLRFSSRRNNKVHQPNKMEYRMK